MITKSEKLKNNTQRKHESVRNMVNLFYNEKRMRWDDVLEEVAFQHFISVQTVRNILKMPDPVIAHK